MVFIPSGFEQPSRQGFFLLRFPSFFEKRRFWRAMPGGHQRVVPTAPGSLFQKQKKGKKKKKREKEKKKGIKILFVSASGRKKVAGHGYVSANASRPEVICRSQFSAKCFGQLFRLTSFAGSVWPRIRFYSQSDFT